jgi:hypothetical protein
MPRGTVIACLLAACGDHREAVDAKAPCWPIDTSTPGGEVEVGTGIGGYEPMPDRLPLVYGVQMGYHITARARIRGLNPGEPNDTLNSSRRNPLTLFRAFGVADRVEVREASAIGVPLCPYKLFYDPAENGDGSVYPAAVEIRFDTSLQLEDIVEKQYNVTIEVIDIDGHYAKAEKVITATAPE